MKALFSTIIVSMFFFINAFAQVSAPATHTVSVKVPEVAMISVVGSGADNSVSLEFAALSAAGEWFSEVTSTESIYLRLSSLKPSADREVQVSANVPAGLTLKVTAGTNTGGKGTTGTPKSNVIIGSNASDLITGIGSGYTGNTSTNGFPLTYKLSVDEDNVASLASATTAITVTYTITE